MTDEILKEMHAIKDANGRKYRTGFAAMMRDLRQRQEQSGRRIIRTSRQPAKSRKAADSLLKLGLSLGRLGQHQQACAAYSQVDDQFPKATEAKKRAQAESKRAGC